VTDWSYGIVKQCSRRMLVAIIQDAVEKIGGDIILREAEDSSHLLSIRDGFNFLFADYSTAGETP